MAAEESPDGPGRQPRSGWWIAAGLLVLLLVVGLVVLWIQAPALYGTGDAAKTAAATTRGAILTVAAALIAATAAGAGLYIARRSFVSLQELMKRAAGIGAELAVTDDVMAQLWTSAGIAATNTRFSRYIVPMPGVGDHATVGFDAPLRTYHPVAPASAGAGVPAAHGASGQSRRASGGTLRIEVRRVFCINVPEAVRAAVGDRR